MQDATRHAGPVPIGRIAELAGVSVATVSKVLNGRPDVAAQTRARVEAVIEQQGYRRRRARSSTLPPLIDLVLNELDSAWSIEVITGVKRVASGAGIDVVLSELGGAHRPTTAWLDRVLARRPVGVLLVQADIDREQRNRLLAASIPCVVIDTAGEPPIGVPTVGSGNWSGGLAATRHLLGLGHRRVGVISGPLDVLCSRARVDGYRTAHEELGLTVDPELIRYGNFVFSGGYQHGLDLLDRPDRPTALFAGADAQALGVIRAAAELGLRVPDDLSVVGYDDLQIAQWTVPALTTVRQPLHAMAATAMDMVLELAAGRTPANPRIELATELVVRGSTAPWPGPAGHAEPATARA